MSDYNEHLNCLSGPGQPMSNRLQAAESLIAASQNHALSETQTKQLYQNLVNFTHDLSNVCLDQPEMVLDFLQAGGSYTLQTLDKRCMLNSYTFSQQVLDMLSRMQTSLETYPHIVDTILYPKFTGRFALGLPVCLQAAPYRSLTALRCFYREGVPFYWDNLQAINSVLQHMSPNIQLLLGSFLGEVARSIGVQRREHTTIFEIIGQQGMSWLLPDLLPILNDKSYWHEDYAVCDSLAALLQPGQVRLLCQTVSAPNYLQLRLSLPRLAARATLQRHELAIQRPELAGAFLECFLDTHLSGLTRQLAGLVVLPRILKDGNNPKRLQLVSTFLDLLLVSAQAHTLAWGPRSVLDQMNNICLDFCPVTEQEDELKAILDWHINYLHDCATRWLPINCLDS